MEILFFFFSLGFFSLLSQSLILREFIISFNGNELGIAFFYGFWLFWVGVGGYLVKTKFKNIVRKTFPFIIVSYPILGWIEFLLFINLRNWTGIEPWEFFSLEKIFTALFLFTFPISFLTGIIFTQSTFFLKEKSKISFSGVFSSAYALESLGSFFAGVFFSLLTLRAASPLTILGASTILFYLANLIFTSKGAKKFKFSHLVNIFLIGFYLLLLNSPYFYKQVAYLRKKNIFPSGELIRQTYTPYQHIFINQLPSQVVLLSNSSVLEHFPENIDSDKEAALFMAEGDFPSRILIFGYGAENLIHSLLKFPVNNITYCLEDKIYYKTLLKHLPPSLREDLQSRRVKVVFSSPLTFLKHNKSKFSLIITYGINPISLSLNRFYTKEFFALVKKNLKERGIFVTKIASAENYLGEEIRNYGSSIYYTLKSIFPKIIITPGEINYFFAAERDSPLTDEPLKLEKNLQKHLPPNLSFLPSGYRSIFLKERLDYVRTLYLDNPLFKRGSLINTYQRPLVFFLNLLIMARYSNSFLVKFFKNVFFLGGGIFFIFILSLFVSRFLFLFRIENIKEKREIFNSKLFQFISGFLGFSFHLSLIFIFQNKFGTIFENIALVNGLFMLGLFLGAKLAASLLKRVSYLNGIIFVLGLEAGLLFLARFIPSFSLNIITFYSLFLLIGLLTGTSYSLSAAAFSRQGRTFLDCSASLELLDHWGGATASSLTGIFFLPLLGVKNTFLLLFVLASFSGLIFLFEKVPLKILKHQRLAKNLSFPYIRTSYCLGAIFFSLFLVSIISKNKIELTPETDHLNIKKVQSCRKIEKPFSGYKCDEKGNFYYAIFSKDYAPQIKGFAGPINLLIKIDKNNTIKEIEALEHKETPLYVGDMEKFLSQFKGKKLSDNFNLKSIDAMTAATITSEAIVKILNKTSRKIYSQEVNYHKKVRFNLASCVLLFFFFAAVIIHFYFPSYSQVRFFYLLLVVIILGMKFNFTFSLLHLGNLLSFNFSFHFSQIILLLVIIFSGIFLGRFWCGWLCPFGALQELLRNKHNISPSQKLNTGVSYFKFIFLFLAAIVIIIKGDALFFRQEPLAIFFFHPFNIGREKILALVTLFFSFIFLRFWCGYFCPVGAVLSLFNKIFIFKKKTPRRYHLCPYGVRGVYDINCLQCDLCLQKKK